MIARIRYKEENGELISNQISNGLGSFIIFIDLRKLYYSISYHADLSNPSMAVKSVPGTSRQDLMKKAKKKLQELGVQFKVEDKRKKKRIEAVTKVINKAAEEMNIGGTKWKS